MSFLFSKFSDALKNAIDTRTYGVYYTEESFPDLNTKLGNCHEVILCLTGSGLFLADGKIYEINSGDLMVLNQFDPYKVIPQKGRAIARFGIVIHPDYLSRNSTDKTDLSLCFYKKENTSPNIISLSDTEISKLERLFVSFRNNNSYGDDILKNSAINMMLVHINKYFANHKKNDAENNLNLESLSASLEYINLNFKNDINLKAIAENSHISVNQLCKLFKIHLETTVTKYITAKRICEAKKLLCSGKSVSETALLCGFSDYANFIRVFKKVTGVPPGKYSKL